MTWSETLVFQIAMVAFQVKQSKKIKIFFIFDKKPVP